MLTAPHSSELGDEILAEDDINVDFPSLKAAALFHEKKHDSYSASQARKFKQSRSRTSDSVGSQRSLTEDQSQPEAACCTPETPECIPAFNSFLSALPVQSGEVVWKELQRKSSGSDSDVPVTQRQRVFGDSEQERPVVGISSSHSGKSLSSMTVVLADFLPPSQVSSSSDEQSSEFVPMFVCTLCGARTHSCRDCSHHLAETFCD